MMNTRNTRLALCATTLLALVTTGARPATSQDDPKGVQVVPVHPLPTPQPIGPSVTAVRDIDLAICLDTSGSMQGLLEATKQKLWAIVNDLALIDPAPRLRVALLTYGNDGHRAEDGWVRIDTALTEDLDLVSQKLFALSTNGGTELVGRVLDRATTALRWSTQPEAMKWIVVAGNESADQDSTVPFRGACRRAIGVDILVNSIFCGPPTHGDAPGWREIAKLADGHYANIDQAQGTVVVESPFDDQLTALSTGINATYLAYGVKGRAGSQNQVAQDLNASGLNKAASAGRAETKAGKLYFCDWDLVDVSAREGFVLEDVAEEELPEVMRPMTPAERKLYLEQMRANRGRLQKEIGALANERKDWILKQLQERGLDESKSFDGALRKALRSQVRAKGFQYPTAPPAAETQEAPSSGQKQEAAGKAAPAERKLGC
ncbi:MAG: vWA domain-containing protein [Planctomycetota bacterium]